MSKKNNYKIKCTACVGRVKSLKTMVLILFTAFPVLILAENVDTNHAAALVDTQDVKAPGALQSAMFALISKGSGLNAEAVESQSWLDSSFSSLILRHYFEQTPRQEGTQQYWLHVIADEKLLREKIIEKEIPIWPKRRQPLLVWMVAENSDGILSFEPNQGMNHYWLSKWFENKGVPADFYQVSETDLMDFSPEDVKNLNPDVIDYMQQVQQYDDVLLVYVKDTGRGFSYRMGLTKLGEETIIKHRQFVELSQGFGHLTDFVQSHQAADQQIFANELADRTISVQVNNIQNADQMLMVLNYLDGQSLVNKSHVSAFKNQVLSLRLDISVLPETFARFVDKSALLSYLPLDTGNHLIFSVQQAH